MCSDLGDSPKWGSPERAMARFASTRRADRSKLRRRLCKEAPAPDDLCPPLWGGVRRSGEQCAIRTCVSRRSAGRGRQLLRSLVEERGSSAVEATPQPWGFRDERGGGCKLGAATWREHAQGDAIAAQIFCAMRRAQCCLHQSPVPGCSEPIRHYLTCPVGRRAATHLGGRGDRWLSNGSMRQALFLDAVALGRTSGLVA